MQNTNIYLYFIFPWNPAMPLLLAGHKNGSKGKNKIKRAEEFRLNLQLAPFTADEQKQTTRNTFYSFFLPLR